MRDSLCMIAQARASHAQSNTHTHSVQKHREWRNRDCAVVTMALVSDFSHPESTILLKAILIGCVQGKSLLVELFQRHFLPASFVHHFFTITTGRYSSVIASIAIFSIPSVARTVFSSDLVLGLANAFLCPSPRRCCICLSHIVSDSDVCASVSVSCSRSCPLTSAEFCSCGMPPGSILLSSGLPHSRSAFLRMSHILHCCQRSSRSERFASMSTRSLMIHPSTPAVLPAPATVHSLAVLPALALTQTPACFQAMPHARATTMLSPANV